MRGFDSYLRWLYRTGRPNAFARLQNRMSAWLFATGVAPRRVAALGIRGRRSGRVIWFPMAVAELDGRRYVVSMLGKDTNWVRNLAAAEGRAVLRHGRREEIQLTEVDPADRGPILQRYLRVAPGARPHIPVGPDGTVEEFQRIAPDYPVFRIDDRPVAQH
ncbi:nitroreductase family deazaflavin-dependent oxidoreductase [Nocardia sp. CS682]|uniref:nitroreductase family deazaflavin-dependent oxidoreductase n=1 Tax=Nocardia sp. CS682 TaxID=1047172 RepID=UPI001074AEF9|nr:nitroreductase family deazaflavin-dependent oxidoreductase [Nocardia sp. CS682]QBS45341.1 nitroreductase family deazaflavin-dependent oxidoreductase [Nocardia sp. CS682]